MELENLAADWLADNWPLPWTYTEADKKVVESLAKCIGNAVTLAQKAQAERDAGIAFDMSLADVQAVDDTHRAACFAISRAIRSQYPVVPHE